MPDLSRLRASTSNCTFWGGTAVSLAYVGLTCIKWLLSIMFIFFSLSDILLQRFPALTIWFPIILLLNIIVKHEPGCEAAAECGARSGSGGAARRGSPGPSSSSHPWFWLQLLVGRRAVNMCTPFPNNKSMRTSERGQVNVSIRTFNSKKKIRIKSWELHICVIVGKMLQINRK